MKEENKRGIEIYNTEFFYGGIGIMWFGLMLCIAFDKVNELGMIAIAIGLTGVLTAVVGVSISLWALDVKKI